MSGATLTTVRALIALRIEANRREFDDAVQFQRWSQVSGLDGIGTGLLMALRIIDDELRQCKTKP